MKKLLVLLLVLFAINCIAQDATDTAKINKIERLKKYAPLDVQKIEIKHFKKFVNKQFEDLPEFDYKVLHLTVKLQNKIPYPADENAPLLSNIEGILIIKDSLNKEINRIKLKKEYHFEAIPSNNSLIITFKLCNNGILLTNEGFKTFEENNKILNKYPFDKLKFEWIPEKIFKIYK